jgi:hypothetical protein
MTESRCFNYICCRGYDVCVMQANMWEYRNVFKVRWGHAVPHCNTSRKVAGSIPDCIIGTFHWYNPFGRTMALRL